ncbi:MAG: ABC transporter substrate-binding protein [Lachnospiraceae bacterium]|nr:ABC transporter substrate-binding protein [Lachnospiraceae bacterium]
MKNCKKVISLVLAAAMMFTMLTGCGNNGAKADTWKIGGIGPETGDYAAYGLGVKNAIELAVEEINANGGINGVQIEYKFEDDVTDNEKSVNAYNALKDWGMNVLIGCVTSGCCIAVADKTAADNMFQLTPSASAVDCVKNDNVFQVCFTDPNQGIGSAQYIGENAMASKVAVIYNSSDVYSTGIYEKFVAEAANQPFEIVATEAFTNDSKTDFSVQLQKAKEAGAELLFLPIYYQEATLILTQAADMDFAPVFFGCDGLDGILTGVKGFDASLAEGVILLTPFAADGTDEATVKFVTAYQEKYGEVPNQFAADAYDAVYILKAAIEKSGATPADGVSGICDKLKAAMTEISYDGLTGESMTWSATGEVNKAPKAMKIVNGSYSLIQ